MGSSLPRAAKTAPLSPPSTIILAFAQLSQHGPPGLRQQTGTCRDRSRWRATDSRCRFGSPVTRDGPPSRATDQSRFSSVRPPSAELGKYEDNVYEANLAALQYHANPHQQTNPGPTAMAAYRLIYPTCPAPHRLTDRWSYIQVAGNVRSRWGLGKIVLAPAFRILPTSGGRLRIMTAKGDERDQMTHFHAHTKTLLPLPQNLVIVS